MLLRFFPPIQPEGVSPEGVHQAERGREESIPGARRVPIVCNTNYYDDNKSRRLNAFSSDLQEHKNCGEMTEIEAKVKYVKLARSLRTYGVSFFLVKVR